MLDGHGYAINLVTNVVGKRKDIEGWEEKKRNVYNGGEWEEQL